MHPEDAPASVERELAYLVVHGVLHILGHDHEDVRDVDELARRIAGANFHSGALESMQTVTGPSLTSETFMSAPKTPASTTG